MNLAPEHLHFYEKMMKEVPKGRPSVVEKLEQVQIFEQSKVFESSRHRELFVREIGKANNVENRYMAVIFLLTGSDKLWEKTERYVYKNTVDFGNIGLRGLDSESYVLLKAADDIYNEKNSISLGEIGSEEIIGKDAARLILAAVYISRYGLQAF